MHIYTGNCKVDMKSGVGVHGPIILSTWGNVPLGQGSLKTSFFLECIPIRFIVYTCMPFL